MKIVDEKTNNEQNWSLLTDREVQSPTGEYLGKVIEVIRNKTELTIEYLILEVRALFGGGSRFFAVPALPDLINVNNRGKIILEAEKDALQFARGVRLEQCPKPDRKFDSSILELYEYTAPGER